MLAYDARRASSSGPDDGQYRISFSGRITVGGTCDAEGVKDDVSAATGVVPGRYVVEAAIRLPTITLEKGTLLGFDVQVHDATGTARRRRSPGTTAPAAATWTPVTGASCG
ncbi:MAG TPA: sugar-binding protein [Nonomuraea sp.]|nr:sugar-binding protein [Nonomuraea sp.]